MDKTVVASQTAASSTFQNNISNSGISIFELNDDCLRCILAFLPFRDRLRLQRVSKRWQSLMPWNGQKKLEISYDSFMLGQEDWMPYSIPIIKKVLNLCGNFITDIKLSDCDYLLSSSAQYSRPLLKKSCPNLVSLDLSGFDLDKKFIQFMIANVTHVKSVSIGEFSKGCEKEIAKFFSKAQNLQEIQFNSNTVSGSCLTALPLASIEKFRIMGCGELLLEHVCKALHSMSNLSTLDIMDNLLLIENVDKLLDGLPNRSKLEHLSLHVLDIPGNLFQLFDREKTIQMKNLCYLTNLQQLFLCGPQVVHDEALTIIGNTCTKLRKATIINSHKLTDAGWKNFAKLRNLEELKIEKLESISEECLLCLPASSLKALICYQVDFDNQSLQVLLKSAKNLNLLDVAMCPRVNFVTLVKDGSAQIESRPKHEFLKLRVEMSEGVCEIKNISSRLVVQQTNCYKLDLEKQKLEIYTNNALFNQIVLFADTLKRERNRRRTYL